MSSEQLGAVAQPPSVASTQAQRRLIAYKVSAAAGERDRGRFFPARRFGVGRHVEQEHAATGRPDRGDGLAYVRNVHVADGSIVRALIGLSGALEIVPGTDRVQSENDRRSGREDGRSERNIAGGAPRLGARGGLFRRRRRQRRASRFG